MSPESQLEAIQAIKTVLQFFERANKYPPYKPFYSGAIKALDILIMAIEVETKGAK